MNYKEIKYLIARYVLLLILPLGNLYLFYLVFTPLTLYLSYWALNLLYGAVIVENNLLVSGYLISLVPACIAGAAYYLLLILNLATPMPFRKRMLSLLFLFASFLVLNVLRIVLFSFFLLKGYVYFDAAHLLTWYFGSTLLLILIWFGNAWLFKIKSIPIYTDMKIMFADISRRKRR